MKIEKALRSLGLNDERLAKKANLSSERSRELLAGAAPSAHELREIALRLRLPTRALIDPDQFRLGADVRFRSSKMNEEKLFGANARISSIENILCKDGILNQSVISHRSEANLDSLSSIEDISISIRERIFDRDRILDPIFDLVNALDTKDICSVICLSNFPVHGACLSFGRSYAIVIARQFPPRSLFSVAHELGHLLFHLASSTNSIVDFDNLEGYKSQDDEERLCDTFAGAFLMPAQSAAKFLDVVRRTLNINHEGISDIEVLYLCRYFGLSFLPAAFRLEQLGFLPRHGAIRLSESLKDRYGSAEKAAQHLELPKRTSIGLPIFSEGLRLRLRRSVTEGLLSLGQLADAFVMPEEELFDALS